MTNMLHDIEPRPSIARFASTLHKENIRLTEELARVRGERDRLKWGIQNITYQMQDYPEHIDTDLLLVELQKLVQESGDMTSQ